MGLILSHEEILDYLEENNLRNDLTEGALVYAQVMPSAGQFLLFGPYAQLVKGSYFVLTVDKERLILIPLHKLTGKIDRKVDPMFIPFAEIEQIKIKNGLLWYTVTIVGEGQELPLKLSKNAVGMKWHKNNLEPTIHILENMKGAEEF